MARVSVVALALLLAACESGGTGWAAVDHPGALPASEPFEVSQVTLHGPEGQAVEVPVYVADTDAKRARGLQFREDLPAGTGMVFVYPQLHTGPFYMKNTLIPLSIAFYGPEGSIRRVLDMQPCEADPCELYNPGVAYTGALEVNQGFFGEIGLDPTWTVEPPTTLP
jgi:hypothetical protein